MAFRDVSSSYGRKGQPRIKATCDRCPREEVICCPKGAEGQATKKIQKMGWSLIKQILRCPKCEAKRKAENMSQKVTPATRATPARQPTRAQRREIHLLLVDCYDCDKERYQRGDTDETIAEVLGVMPGWVAEIREQGFGPNGGNADIEVLAKQCQSFLKDARAMVANRDKETEALATAIKQVSVMAEALAKIGKAVGPRVMARAK